MILVAGGSGFLGLSVCQKFIELGHPVVCVDISPPPCNLNIYHHADIRKREELETVFQKYPIKTIINLAAILNSGSTHDPLLSFQVNVTGNLNLLDLAQKFSVPRYIFAGSYTALGLPEDPAQYVDENLITNPTNIYGITKEFVEKYGLEFSKIYGFEFIIARLPLIVGPGIPTETSAWRADMFNLLNPGGEISFGFDSDQVIPLLHTEDAARFLAILATSKQVNFPIYHIPFENWQLEELGMKLTSINPGLHVSYGSKKYEGAPVNISFERFSGEFQLEPPSLLKYLLEKNRLRK